MAWRNLIRGWRRSVIALAAISFGLAACVLVVGLSKGMTYQMTDTAVGTRLGHVTVHASGYNADPQIRRNLPDGGRAILQAARALPGVAASVRLEGEGVVQSARKGVRARFLGVDARGEWRISTVPGSLVEGGFLDAAPAALSFRRLPSIVIGAKMAERLGTAVGRKVVVHVPGDAGLAAFRVRGIYRTASSEFDGTHAFMSLENAQALFDVPDRVTEVTLFVDDPSRAPWVQARLRERLDRTDLEVLRWQERAPKLAAVVEAMDQISWIFYAAVFVAMAFGIANVLFMAVYERMREFGIMRAVGLKPRGLLVTVLLESVVLTATGTGLGLWAGFLLVAWLDEHGLDLAWFSEGLRAFGVGTTIHPRVDLGEVGWPVAIATVTALVSGFFPALRAARLRPAEALRHT
jgi:ABC-type lipoprotein release transport system permease subunit